MFERYIKSSYIKINELNIKLSWYANLDETSFSVELLVQLLWLRAN
jgi:hypothetical protein